MSLGQETLVTARPGPASEFSAGQLPQYTEDTLVIHDEVSCCHGNSTHTVLTSDLTDTGSSSKSSTVSFSSETRPRSAPFLSPSLPLSLSLCVI